MLVATIWAFFLLPETKGLTIDQMDLILYLYSALDSFSQRLTCSYSGYKNDRPYQIPHTPLTAKMTQELREQQDDNAYDKVEKMPEVYTENVKGEV